MCGRSSAARRRLRSAFARWWPSGASAAKTPSEPARRAPAGGRYHRPMPSFLRGEVALWWAESGAPDGFPVILHTGGAGAGSMWQSGGYVERLAGFRLLLFDHRGHGRSGRPASVEAHRIEEYVADAAALADAVGLDGYAFVGYSFGGAVGL